MKDSIIPLIAFSNAGEDWSVGGRAAGLSCTLLQVTSSELLHKTQNLQLSVHLCLFPDFSRG